MHQPQWHADHFVRRSAMEPPSDESVVAAEKSWPERIRRGDVPALEAMHRAYFTLLQAYAQGYVRSREAAEEIVEDVFVRIWERRYEWEVQGDVRRYLYGAVRKRSLHYLRHRRIRDRIHDALIRTGRSPAMGEGPTSAADEVEAGQLAAMLSAGIAKLPERCREAFLLGRTHGLSHAQISQVMGISTSTVEKHIVRATRELRDIVAHWMSDPLSAGS